MLLPLLIIALIALIIGSITDLKKREVNDYVSYGLIIIAFTAAIIYSIVNSEYTYLMNTIMGFIIGLLLAYAMFYLGQWGGGDSKLLMGLGAIFGFNIFSFFGKSNYWFLVFLGCIIFSGALYGLLWSFYLAIKNKSEFKKTLILFTRKKSILILRKVFLISLIVLSIINFFLTPPNYKIAVFAIIALTFIIFYLWLFVKIIEESCMIKKLSVYKLTEGDWINENVYIGKKLIAGPKDLGISKKQISALKIYAKKGKIKYVTVKEGIPFIPAFLIAYLITLGIYYLL